MSELYDFVYSHVKDETSGEQHPELKGKFDNDMPIAVSGAAISNTPLANTPLASSSPSAPKGNVAKCAPDEIEDCQAKRDQGSAESCYAAGYGLQGFTADGKFARKSDFKRAAPYFQKGCDAGDGDSCSSRRVRLRIGRSVRHGDLPRQTEV